MIRIQRLSNGIQVVTEKVEGLRSVALGVFVKTGSAYESSENNGIAHMIEHMLFKGTSKHSAKELADIMTMLGGNMNAYTAKECTSFYCRTLDTQIEQAIDILGDMICNSVFDVRDISKEKQVILDEIDMYNDSPEDMVHELLQKKVWSGSSLGYIISGSKKNVKNLKQKDLLEFWKEHYSADRIVISLAGNFDESRVMESLEASFGALSGLKRHYDIIKPEYRQCFVKKHQDIEQAHINIAFESIGYNAKERYALSVTNAILGGSLNSKLFQYIREELGLTYSIYTYESLYTNSGLFHIYATMNPQQIEYVLSSISTCVNCFVESGVTEEELVKTKNQLITEYILGLESTSVRMENNARSLLLQGKIFELNEVVDRISEVKMEDVKMYLDEYVDLDRSSLCVVGNMNEINIERIRKAGM